MSSGTGLGKGGAKDTQLQQLLQRLRCCRGLERMVEKDLRDIDWSKQEKIFVMLFLRIGVKALHNCVAERSADKKPMSTAERRQTEEAFQTNFQRLVVKHLQIAGYKGQLSPTDLIFKRRDFHDAVEFLLECQDQVPSEHDRSERPTVGKGGGGNPRTPGEDGYKPMLSAVLRRREDEAAAASPTAATTPTKRGAGNDGPGSGNTSGGLDDGTYSDDTSRQLRYLQLEMARLKKENRQLRQDKRAVETVYQQLITEQRHEKFDERRLNVLKAQNIQLERQLALVQNALYQRRSITTEVHQILVTLADKLQTAVDGEIRPAGISANQAGKVVETISSLLERLQKLHTQITAPSRLQQQLYYPNLSHSSANGTSEHEQVQRSFRDPGRVRPNFTRPKNATIFVDDAVRMAVTDGAKVRHIDLEAVETLERVLGTLSPKLLALRQALCTISLPNMLLPGQERVAKLASDCCTAMHRASYDLTTLSALMPSGPLTKQRDAPGRSSYASAGPSDDNPAPLSPLPSVEDLMKALPSGRNTTGKAGSGAGLVPRTAIERPVTALLKWQADREAWLHTVAESIGAELNFYSSAHTVQNEYVTRLCKDVEERQLSNDDGSMLQDVINSFEAFELNTSEATLRTFLKVFKHHQPAIQSVCERVSRRSISHSMRRAIEDLRRSYQAKYSGLLAKRLALMEQSTTSRSVFETALSEASRQANTVGGAATEASVGINIRGGSAGSSSIKPVDASQ